MKKIKSWRVTGNKALFGTNGHTITTLLCPWNLFQKGNQLHANFVPMDVKLKNFADLPDLLLHPENFILVLRFVKQWHR